MPNVIVIGSINADLFFSTNAFPVPGQTVGGVFMQDYGGKGANQAVAASQFAKTAHCSMIGAVGMDDYGRGAIATLESKGVDVSGIQMIPNTNTSIAGIMVQNDGENAIIVCNGASLLVNSLMIQRTVREGTVTICRGDYIITVLEIPLESTVLACQMARDTGSRVFFTPSPFPFLEQDIQALGRVLIEYRDVITVILNEVEQIQLSDAGIDVSSVARVVTKGSQGSVYYGVSGEVINQRAIPPTNGVVDTSGAGDCFSGTLVAALADGFSMADAMRFAAFAAGCSVGKSGTMRSYPSRDELDSFIEEYK